MFATRLPLRLAGPARAAFSPSALPLSLSLSLSRTFAAARSKKPDSEPRSPTKRPAAKKPASKKPAAATKKPATKKPAATTKKTKELTPEELEAKQARAQAKAARLQAKTQKEELRQLKEKALALPRMTPMSAWNVFVKEKVLGTAGGAKIKGDQFKQIAADFRNLASTEREHYNHLANEATSEIKRTLAAWVQDHTPVEILHANQARKSLRQKKLASFRPIPDDRLVRRPMSSFLIYHQERYASGDYRSIPFKQFALDITSEWNNLSTSEKKTYQDRAEEDLQRYIREYRDVYGVEPPFVTKQLEDAAKKSSPSDD